jgi:hypothetical protein
MQHQRGRCVRGGRNAAAQGNEKTRGLLDSIERVITPDQIAEAQKRADIILEMAQQQALEIIARAHEGNPTGDETIRFMSDEDGDNDT